LYLLFFFDLRYALFMYENSTERLDKILVDRGLAQSRARAQALIESGKVRVGGTIYTASKKPVSANETIELLEEDIPWVSRAALKLIAALDNFHVDPTGRVVLDIGSSTGGFTEVCLSRGADTVYAIDVGRNQMHERLRNDTHVILREGTHINDVTPGEFPEPPSLVVIDVSFISLTKVLGKAAQLLAPKGDIVALIKPQFEVGKENIGKGVVHDAKLRESARDAVVAFARELGFAVEEPILSPIEGSDGNVEYLMHAHR
jgi:23S rRNA (cytidine1920-2'-O)/16S rRNA (cytidine1409-2'-O)-methyltransferase